RDIREGELCATLFRTVCKSLVLNGEMAEWSIAHAWKLNPLARADAHQIPPTHFRFNDSRNIDMRRRVPVNEGVAPRLRGVCDTVLTQRRFLFNRRHTDAHRLVHSIQRIARA